RQGRALLSHLGAPDHLIAKAPTADLLDDEPGQTDESSLGLSYDQIDDFLEGREIEAAAASALIEEYRRSGHKRRTPGAPTASWGSGTDPASDSAESSVTQPGAR